MNNTDEVQEEEVTTHVKLEKTKYELELPEPEPCHNTGVGQNGFASVAGNTCQNLKQE